MQKNLVIFGLVWCLLFATLTPVSLAEETLKSPNQGLEEPSEEEKSPWLAFAFSLAVPGTGQMYVEERVWPEVLITAGLALGVVVFFLVDQQRTASLKYRTVTLNGVPTTERLPDAHWEAFTLALQLALPGLWIWNFGDSTTSVDWSPTHTYESVGVYSTYLAVSNASGCTDTAWMDIIVNDFYTFYVHPCSVSAA